MKYIFSNWKMYLGYQESLDLADQLKKEKWNKDKVEVAVFPIGIAFAEIAKKLAGSDVSIGAQNVAWAPRGAYTGAISAEIFKAAGSKFALVGHSERRYIFNETNDDVRKKIDACLAADLIPVLCVGETKEDLEQEKREYRLKKQLLKVFEGLILGHNQKFFIAYEPVWAISQGGKGLPCSPDDADDVQGWIKNEIKQYTDQAIPVLYGGSVNEDNVLSYIEREAVDGVLVGSASTKIESFSKMVAVAQKL
jgi:triosephosphate isomerase (TIM)